jgi:hypothetical protein
MFAHVYLVTNTKNGKNYVGQTIRAENKLGHGRMLLSAYKFHGKDSFTYEKICNGIGNRATLNFVERFWIKVFNSIAPNGYNIELGGSEGSTWTEERRRKHGLALKGHRGWRKGLNLPSPNKGKVYPEEGKRKLSEVMKGNKFALGYKHTEETKEKMSASQKAHWDSLEVHPNKGRKASAETRAKMSEKKKQQIQSEETRQKRSETIKLWHKQRKEQSCQLH